MFHGAASNDHHLLHLFFADHFLDEHGRFDSIHYRHLKVHEYYSVLERLRLAILPDPLDGLLAVENGVYLKQAAALQKHTQRLNIVGHVVHDENFSWLVDTLRDNVLQIKQFDELG